MDGALARAFETLEQLEKASETTATDDGSLAPQLAVLRFLTFEIYRRLDSELSEQSQRQTQLAALDQEKTRLELAIQSHTKQASDYEVQAVAANGQAGLLAQYNIAAPKSSDENIETVISNEADARRDLFRQNAELKLHAEQLQAQRDDITKFLYDSSRINTWFNELIGFARKIQREHQHTYDVLVTGIEEPDPVVTRRSGRGDRGQRRREEVRETERERRRRRDEVRRDEVREVRRGEKRSDERPPREPKRPDEQEMRRDARRDDRRTDRRDERRDDRFDARREPAGANRGAAVHREDDRQRGARPRRDRKRRRRD